MIVRRGCWQYTMAWVFGTIVYRRYVGSIWGLGSYIILGFVFDSSLIALCASRITLRCSSGRTGSRGKREMFDDGVSAKDPSGIIVESFKTSTRDCLELYRLFHAMSLCETASQHPQGLRSSHHLTIFYFTDQQLE